MKVPILELNYLKKSDILSSNTSEMKYMVICAMLFTPMLFMMLLTLIFAMLFASFEQPNCWGTWSSSPKDHVPQQLKHSPKNPIPV